MTAALHVAGVKQKVLEILGDNPALPYSIIANEVGVTRERVRQIARQSGYPSRKGILEPKKCSVCGKTYYTRKQYCSHTCVYRARQNRIYLNCHQCGKPIERIPGDMRSRSGNYFCTRECFMRWVVKKRFHGD